MRVGKSLQIKGRAVRAPDRATVADRPQWARAALAQIARAASQRCAYALGCDKPPVGGRLLCAEHAHRIDELGRQHRARAEHEARVKAATRQRRELEREARRTS